VALAATPEEPDLQALPPRDLQFATTQDTTPHNLLRFTYTAWNAGAGPLDLRGNTSTDALDQEVHQSDGSTQTHATAAGLDPATDHVLEWARFELFKQGGSTPVVPAVDRDAGCLVDEEPVEQLAAMPWPAVFPNECNVGPDQIALGISPGWGDTFDAYKDGQFFDLGTSPLPDGTYTIKVTADPTHKLVESDTSNNVASVDFTVTGGVIGGTTPPSGTVVIDPVRNGSNVTLHVLGRDDHSAVQDVRFSNDGQNWSDPQGYVAKDTHQPGYWVDYPWTLAPGSGPRTVYAQFDDGSLTWTGPVSTATVVIPAAPTPPAPPAPPPAGPGNQQNTQSNPIATISRVLARPSKFRATRTRHVKHGGTTFRFTLSQAGRLLITIQRNTQVATKHRYKKVGTLRVRGKAGANKVRFRGWIGHRKLKPGRYRAVARVVGAPKGTMARTVTFRILP
jgi:hypothetical protein